MRKKVFLYRLWLLTLVAFTLCYYLFILHNTGVSENYLKRRHRGNIRRTNFFEPETHQDISEDAILTVTQENISSQVFLNTTLNKLTIFFKNVLCPVPEKPKTISNSPGSIPKVYWASSPKNISDQRRYITATFDVAHGIGNMFPIEKEVYIAGDYAVDCCKYDNPKKIENITAQYVRVGGNYLQSYKFFHEYRDEIRQIFQCGPGIMEKVDISAKLIFGNDKGNTHFLCAHIRRGDFFTNVMLESKKDFVEPAIEYAFYYLQKQGHKNISLYFIGTDLPFILDLNVRNIGFSKIYLPGSLPRGDDMCLAIHYCDSMVMTASGSTYGWWMSYLMPDNSTIFYNSQISDHAYFSKDVHDYDIFLDEWIRLTVNNNTLKREKLWWYQRHNWSLEQANAT